MKAQGIEAVFVSTHNWGQTAKFFKSLGFELEFETDHSSGQLRCGDGPFVFVAEVPADVETGIQLVLRADDENTAGLDPVVEIVTPFEDTHYGTREMTVRDPDGRTWSVQTPSTHPSPTADHGAA